MKRNFFGIIIVGLMLTACGGKKQPRHRAGIPTVGVVEIPTENITTSVSFPANIEGVVNVDVRAKIAGYITDVLVDEGEKVHKGQLLFKLETHTLTQQAEAAKASIDAAQVQVNQLKPLVKKGIVSESQLASAKAKLAQAKSNYQSIKANIGYSEIRSPINGYVGKIRLRKGNLVSPSSPQPLTVVTDISEVYAYFSMNEADYLNFMEEAKGKTRAEKIKHLPKVQLVMANGETYPTQGTIQTVNSQVDPQTGTIAFRAIFKNPKQLLTNGSSGKIKIPKVYKNIVVVPQVSTFEVQDKTFVMKVVKKGDTNKVISTTIEVENKVRGLYLVSEGVKKGDKIVARGVGKINDGSTIKPKLIPFDSIAKPLPVIFIK